MERPILFDYFNNTADVLIAKYNRSKGQSASNNLGRNREIFCSNFLNKVLPPKLKCSSGELIDSENKKTGQLDLIIIRDDAPCLEYGSENTYLAEGVFAIIEIKSNLERSKLIEAGNSFMKVKSLNTSDSSATITIGDVLDRPLRILFGYEGASWNILLDEVTKQGWEDLFDLICILNRGVLLAKGRLIKFDEQHKFLLINGKAAAIGFIYFYTIKYGTNFLGRSLPIENYFKPISQWNSI